MWGWAGEKAGPWALWAGAPVVLVLAGLGGGGGGGGGPEGTAMMVAPTDTGVAIRS